MKTLDQIEPRKPIKSVPFTISQPGSYYLTRNLQFTAKTGDAITVSASDVTIDLAGFTISSSPEVTGNAVHITSSSSRVAVQNGGIVGNTVVTVTGNSPNQTWSVKGAGFSKGILAEGPSSYQFNQLRVSGCRLSGIEATAGPVNIRDVMATQNGTIGIFAGSNGFGGNIVDCVAFQNGGDGINNSSAAVVACAALQNGGYGVVGSFSSIVNSTGALNALDGLRAVNGSINNCTTSGNHIDGIDCLNTTVMNSSASFNGSHGIAVNGGVVAFCVANQNNQNFNGSVDISATNATRTGNNPTP